ncbi:MAG: AI-2E family transporter [Gillisia sp.]
MADKPDAADHYSFVQKVWIVGGIFALIAVLLLLFRATFSVFLLVLGGVLIASFFRGISSFIKQKTNWKSGVCLAISIIGSLLIFAGIFWLIGSKALAQIGQLSQSLPAAFQDAKSYLNDGWLGKKIVQKISEAQSNGKISSFFATFFRTTFGYLGDIYLILLIGIFFTVSPQIYRKGMVKLVPPRGRDRADKITAHLGSSLQKWLAGKIFAMFVVFVLTSIGLVIMGVPMWLGLAIIAGFLNFIPNFGPLIAMIPAAAIGFSQGQTTGFLIIGLYLVVQFLESNLITPQVQQRLVEIPPAAIIISQVLVGALTGIWGVIFATPLVLIVMILVQELYVKPMDQQ